MEFARIGGMLTNKIQHIPEETELNNGAEVIVMHPEPRIRVVPSTTALHRVEPVQDSNMPEQPTSYLRPKKYDYL